MLWHCWLDVRKSRPIIYCFTKIQTGVTFLVSAYLGHLAKESVNGSVKRWRGGSGISWTICKSFAPRSRQITTPSPQHSIFTSRTVFLTPNQQHRSTEGISCSSSLSNGHRRLLHMSYKLQYCQQRIVVTIYSTLWGILSIRLFVKELERETEKSPRHLAQHLYTNLCSPTTGSKSKSIKTKHKYNRIEMSTSVMTIIWQELPVIT